MPCSSSVPLSLFLLCERERENQSKVGFFSKLKIRRHRMMKSLVYKLIKLKKKPQHTKNTSFARARERERERERERGRWVFVPDNRKARRRRRRTTTKARNKTPGEEEEEEEEWRTRWIRFRGQFRTDRFENANVSANFGTIEPTGTACAKELPANRLSTLVAEFVHERRQMRFPSSI